MGEDPKSPDEVNRFKDTARRIGTDEDKVRFEAQLAKIAAHKPEPTPARKTKRPSKKPGRPR